MQLNNQRLRADISNALNDSSFDLPAFIKQLTKINTDLGRSDLTLAHLIRQDITFSTIGDQVSVRFSVNHGEVEKEAGRRLHVLHGTEGDVETKAKQEAALHFNNMKIVFTELGIPFKEYAGTTALTIEGSKLIDMLKPMVVVEGDMAKSRAIKQFWQERDKVIGKHTSALATTPKSQLTPS